MKYKFIIFAGIVAVLLSATSCSDDNMKSKVVGEWQLSEFMYEGDDVLPLFNLLPMDGCSFSNIKLTFQTDDRCYSSACGEKTYGTYQCDHSRSIIAITMSNVLGEGENDDQLFITAHFSKKEITIPAHQFVVIPNDADFNKEELLEMVKELNGELPIEIYNSLVKMVNALFDDTSTLVFTKVSSKK